jgi:ankyrin repeat protein
VKQHFDVNARQPDGATALHWAAHWDDLEAADLLIHAGANVNAANDLAVTPLALSCENGNTAMVDKLLQAGAYPNAAVETGETALMTASRGGSLGAVEALLTRGADVNAKEPSRGQTALMWAVAQQHPAIVRALIEHGADIHARSHVRHVYVNRGGRSNGEIEQGGFTPLLFAARQGDINSAELLLAAGANVNETAPDGTSALVVAAHSGHGRFARSSWTKAPIQTPPMPDMRHCMPPC